jgi:hypothetical protein
VPSNNAEYSFSFGIDMIKDEDCIVGFTAKEAEVSEDIAKELVPVIHSLFESIQGGEEVSDQMRAIRSKALEAWGLMHIYVLL